MCYYIHAMKNSHTPQGKSELDRFKLYYEDLPISELR